jgi:hypothetical protein
MQKRTAALIMAFAVGLTALPLLAQDAGSNPSTGKEITVLRQEAVRHPPPAEPYDYFDDPGTVGGIARPLGAAEVTVVLQARGFRDVAVVRQRGATFIAEATGKLGERVRLVFNGRTGGIDGARIIVPPRHRK